MSRFWQQDGSESEESEVQSDQEEEEDDENNDFFRSSSSDDDTGGRRVIRSAKEKRTEELKAIITDIKNKLTANDWNGIMAAFESLTKQWEKSKDVLQKDPNNIPTYYVRILVRIDDALKELKDTKELSSANARAVNTLKQRVKKYNKLFEKEIEAFRQTPINTEDEKSEDEEEDEEAEGDDVPEPVPEPAKLKNIVWTRQVIKAKLVELTANRGKKGTDNMSQIQELKGLVEVASEVSTRLEVLVVLVAAQFDTRSMTNHMVLEQWSSAHRNMMRILDEIEDAPHLKIIEADPEGTNANQDNVVENENEVRLQGSLLGFCERLDDEFVKSLQFLDPHTHEYVQRLRDENLFLLLAVRLESYYRKHGNTFAVHRIALRRIERLYYKREELNPLKVLPKCWHKIVTTEKGIDETELTTELQRRYLGDQGFIELNTTIKSVVRDLATLIYKGQDSRAMTRALLCQVYNLALEEEFYEARDLFLMSHLQESIHLLDISTQILFNRTMVQLGLSAFRHGLIAESHSCLADLYGSGKVKELLAQGIVTRFGEKNLEQEKQAKMRQVPYHMHINLELIDSVHLISAMLLEVPNMAMNVLDNKRKLISKHFRRLLEHHERQSFTGPPENTHDFIMAASHSLREGDVDKCCELLLNLKIWKLVPNADPVKEMLQRKIREEGLRTHLFAHSHMYKSVSATKLAETFHLPLSAVHSIVSKMMVNEELHASWDQPSGCVVMHQVEPSRLQCLALQLADKVSVVVENNEKLLDSLTGSYGFTDIQKSGTREPREWQSRAKSGRGRYQTRPSGGTRAGHDRYYDSSVY